MSKKKQLEVVDKEEKQSNSLENLKGIASAFKSHMNAQFQEEVAYVPNTATVAAVSVSKYLKSDSAVFKEIELPGLPFGNITHTYGKPNTGKCHPAGTGILMYSGDVKPVEDVEIGDEVMGPDSRPRKVLSKGIGREKMYEIVPVKGDSWGCNESHILSLKCSKSYCSKFLKDQVYNMTVKEYLELNTTEKRSLKLYRSSVEFPTQEVLVDPYWVGLWLGDGSVGYTSITSTEKELEPYFEDFAKKASVVYRKRENKERAPTHLFTKPKGLGHYNYLLNFVKNDLIKDNEKRVHKKYLINDRDTRLQLLAGLLDSDGNTSEKGGYEITTKFKGLADDIAFLARSLGFAASINPKKGVIKSLGFEGDYYRVFIQGPCSQIPVKLERRKCRDAVKNPLTSGFKVVEKSVGDYYGFELDGDHLYLLKDFTVTHNTTFLMEQIVAAQKQGVLPILILTEHKFSYDRIATHMGGDPEAILVLHAQNLEQAYGFMEKVLRDLATGKLVVEDESGNDMVIDMSEQDCFIFMDSLGNTMSESELEYDVEDHGKSMGKGAKAIKTLTRRINQLLGKREIRQKCGVLLLNQSYMSMPSYGPSVETPYGGDGVIYSCVLNIRLRRKKDLKMTFKGKDMVVGLETIVQVMKNHITHKAAISSVYTVASGMIPATKEALDAFKKTLR